MVWFTMVTTGLWCKEIIFSYRGFCACKKCFDIAWLNHEKEYIYLVFYDVDIGHLPPQWIMINGSYGEFKFIDGKGELIQKMI